ncbi:hypothetical protein [Nocardioides sp. YIM 152588]|uniref:hypothetical protein n=1 Tax=Nocardioides sp. YIM 152588 TaxID=3158259 RepID=UPI0032E3BA90
MGWEDDLFALFDDLEHQAGALAAADRDEEIADRGRAEYQQVSLASRLMATVGSEVSIAVTGVGRVAGTLERVADGWLLVGSGEHDWVISQGAVGAVEGASVRAVPEVAWSPVTRLGLGSALRRLADVGERCVLHLRDGRRYDGTLRRVGQDFCEIAVGEERRMTLVAFHALAAAQSRG